MNGHRLNADLAYNRRAAADFAKLAETFKHDPDYVTWMQTKVERYTRRAQILEAAKLLPTSKRLDYLAFCNYYD